MIMTKYSARHMVLLPVVFTLFMFLLTLVSTTAMDKSSPLQNSLILFFTIPGHFIMILYVFFSMGKSLFSDELELKVIAKDIVPGLLFGLLALISSSLISIVLPSGQSPIHEFIFNDINPVLIIYILFASFIAPFVEELVFRGFLWKILENKGINKYLTLSITSLLFAGMHFDLYRFPALLAGGFIYGLLRIKTGSAGRSIVAHITNNFIVTFLTFILPFIL